MNVEGSQPAIHIGAIAWLAGPGLTAVYETNLQIKVLTTKVRIRYKLYFSQVCVERTNRPILSGCVPIV
jgi:hypothetical protein